jgi:hypothetical protein
VPAEALVDTGDRQTVFVDLGDGYLEPRQVVAGERFGDRVAIVRGLSIGERVAASGTFLIDAESRMKAAPPAPTGPHRHDAPAPRSAPPRVEPPPAAGAAHGGHSHD